MAPLRAIPTTRKSDAGPFFPIWQGCLNGDVRETPASNPGSGWYDLVILGSARNMWAGRLQGTLDNAAPIVNTWMGNIPKVDSGSFIFVQRVFGSQHPLGYGGSVPAGWRWYTLWVGPWWNPFDSGAWARFVKVTPIASDGSIVPGC